MVTREVEEEGEEGERRRSGGARVKGDISRGCWFGELDFRLRKV